MHSIRYNDDITEKFAELASYLCTVHLSNIVVALGARQMRPRLGISRLHLVGILCRGCHSFLSPEFQVVCKLCIALRRLFWLAAISELLSSFPPLFPLNSIRSRQRCKTEACEGKKHEIGSGQGGRKHIKSGRERREIRN